MCSSPMVVQNKTSCGKTFIQTLVRGSCPSASTPLNAPSWTFEGYLTTRALSKNFDHCGEKKNDQKKCCALFLTMFLQKLVSILSSWYKKGKRPQK